MTRRAERIRSHPATPPMTAATRAIPRTPGTGRTPPRSRTAGPTRSTRPPRRRNTNPPARHPRTTPSRTARKSTPKRSRSATAHPRQQPAQLPTLEQPQEEPDRHDEDDDAQRLPAHRSDPRASVHPVQALDQPSQPARVTHGKDQLRTAGTARDGRHPTTPRNCLQRCQLERHDSSSPRSRFAEWTRRRGPLERSRLRSGSTGPRPRARPARRPQRYPARAAEPRP